MGYDKVEGNLAIVNKQIEDLNLTLAQDAEIVQQMSIVREFLADRSSLAEDKLDEKWQPRFHEFYKAQLSVGVLSEAISELITNQQEPLRKYMKVVLGGGISQGGDPGQARDWFYELSLASTLSKSGFIVHLEEPDLIIEGNGLSQKIGIACKYPSSDKGIHYHIGKGLSQLKKHGLLGFIALGIDQIVVEKANLKRFVDFNIGGKNPIDVLQQHADEQVLTLLKERPQKYPSEDPMDEIVVTLSLAGHYGKPAKLINPTVLSIHCSNTSPIFNDIGLIAQALQQLAGQRAIDGQPHKKTASTNENPPAATFDPMRARHEAAHAVAIDHFGFPVIRINIKPGSPQLTEADWGEFGEALKKINWDDDAQRDRIRPAVIDYVTTLVAGHLAENLVNGAVERISTRIQNRPQLLENPPNGKLPIADRDRTALYLFLVQRNKLEEVVAVERLALEILTRRKAHLDALTDLLIAQGTIEGKMLDNALGKAPGSNEVQA